MPQLEQIHTYLSQIFWLVITFGCLYLILWKTALPRISTIIQEREERIDEDLRKADEFKTEADEAVKAYEKLVSEARLEGQSLIKAANAKLVVEAVSRQDELTEKIKEGVRKSEARIEKARTEAFDNIQSVAAEVAQAAIQRLTGDDVTTTDAESAVIGLVDSQQ